jgi:hypothetical protein
MLCDFVAKLDKDIEQYSITQRVSHLIVLFCLSKEKTHKLTLIDEAVQFFRLARFVYVD